MSCTYAKSNGNDKILCGFECVGIRQLTNEEGNYMPHFTAKNGKILTGSNKFCQRHIIHESYWPYCKNCDFHRNSKASYIIENEKMPELCYECQGKTKVSNESTSWSDILKNPIEKKIIKKELTSLELSELNIKKAESEHKKLFDECNKLEETYKKALSKYKSSEENIKNLKNKNLELLELSKSQNIIHNLANSSSDKISEIMQLLIRESIIKM